MKSLVSTLCLLLGTVSAFAYTHVQLTETTQQLLSNTIYYVLANTTIARHNQSALYVQAGDTAILFIQKGCTLEVKADNGFAGINVPQGATLIIAGEEGAIVKAQGGDAFDGTAGSKGDCADTYAVLRKNSYVGAGGHGGQGGKGAGAGIGGNGGEGGQGGQGGERIYTYDYKSENGLPGVDGQDGQVGQSMGNIYVMGSVEIQAKAGSYKPLQPNGVPGTPDHSVTCDIWGWKHLSAGGGGGGGGGAGGTAPIYDISGGGGGGGGGGGAGSGAFDHYEGPFNYTRRCCGQGGGQGLGQAGLPAQTRNVANQEETENNHKWSGKGGKGGQAGHRGEGGLILVANKANISKDTRVDNIGYINPATCPVTSAVHFDNQVEVEAHEQDYRFYYGMPVREQITTPASVNQSLKFAGYYTAENLQIYDKYGRLTTSGKLLHSQFEHVELTAHWDGPGHIILHLKYQGPNATRVSDDWTSFTIDSVLYLHAGEGMTLTFNPKDYLKEHYHNNDAPWTVNVGPGERASKTFVYRLDTCQIHWRVNIPVAGTPVLLLDRNGQKHSDFIEAYCYGATVVEPQVVYQDEDAKRLVKLTGWENKPVLATQTMQEVVLHGEKQLYAIHIQKNDTGTCRAQNTDGEIISSGSYKQLVKIFSDPKDGYRPIMPRMYQIEDSRVGDTVPCEEYADRVSIFMLPSDVLVQPRFVAKKCTVEAMYIIEPGLEYLTAEIWTNTKQRLQDSLPWVKPEDLDCVTGDIILFWGKVHDPKTVPDDYAVTGGAQFLSYEPIPVERIYSDCQIGGKEVLVPCHAFVAPDGKFAVTITVNTRKKADCKLYNDTWFSDIDSILVNGFPTQMPEDSVLHLHEGDKVSILSHNADKSMVSAGYWKGSTWVELTIHEEKRRTEDGGYITYFHTTAPNRGFRMGLKSGILLPLKHCDTSVEWVAPGAAKKGDTIAYHIRQKEQNKIVRLDSVVICGRDNEVMYCFSGEKAWHQLFAMPDTVSGIYVYAHEEGNYYSITFQTEDGTILQQDNHMQLGDSVFYQGDLPTLDSHSPQWRYQFTGWSMPIHPVDGNAVYVAQFSPYLSISEENYNDLLLSQFAGQTVGVDLIKSIQAGDYQAITLPFDLSLEQFHAVFGTNAFAAEFTDTEAVDGITNLIFDALTAPLLKAGHPYLICPARTTNQTIIDAIVPSLKQDTVRLSAVEFRPVLSPAWLTDEDTQIRFVMNDKVYWPIYSTGPMKALSAYFYLSDIETSVAHPADIGIRIQYDQETTTISANGCADPYTGQEYEVPTHIDAPTHSSAPSSVHKILLGDRLYILRNGRYLYDLQGQSHPFPFQTSK